MKHLRRWQQAVLALLLVVGLVATFPQATLAAPCTYTVQRGDTLGVIARRNGTTVSAILQANPSVTNPNRIRVGQRLELPNCATGTVPSNPTTPVTPVLPAPQPGTTTTPPPPQPAPAAPADLDAALYSRAHDATIMIRHPLDAPQYGGSGIVVGRDGRTFLTAFHVVGDPRTGQHVTRVAVGPFADWRFTADVIATDPTLDLALLRVNEADFPGFAVAPVGRSAPLTTASPIYTLSYPGYEGALVLGKGHFLTEVETLSNRSPLIVTNARATFGSSGGVAVNDQGEVVGIISAGIIGRRFVELLGFSGLNQVTLLVPIDAAAEILRGIVP